MTDEHNNLHDLDSALQRTDFSDESQIRDSLRQRLIGRAAPASRTNLIAHSDMRGTQSDSFQSNLRRDYRSMKQGKLLNVFALGFLALTLLLCVGLIGAGALLRDRLPGGVMESPTLAATEVSPTVPSPGATETSTVFPAVTETVTPTATGSPTAPTGTSGESWSVYQDSTVLFHFSYPVPGQISQNGDWTTITLPIAPATNLSEKYVQIDVSSDVDNCISPLAEGYEPGSLPTETLDIAGISWTKQSGVDAGAGNFYDWEAYSTVKEDRCVVLTFVLHSLNRDNFSTPPAEFDRDSEAAVFTQILETFAWID
jgi:hypothetical protein